MYSFIPQLVIVLAIIGIIVIVFRRTPELQKHLKGVDYKKSGKLVLETVKKLGKKLWHFTLETKEISKKQSQTFSSFSRETFSKINLPKIQSKKVRPDLEEVQQDIEDDDFEAAEKKLIKKIEEDPHDEEAFAGLGRLYFTQKKYKEAVETYKYLTGHHPKNDSYHSALGQAYHGVKKYERAVDAYEKAIELEPDNAKRYINLGITLEAMKHKEEAILNYRKAIELEPDNVRYLNILADALIKNDEKEEAEQVLEKILQMEPTNHRAREKLMQIRF